MRFLLSRAAMRPSLSRLETSANTTGRRSSASRAPELAPSSSGPKLRVKASCCSSVMSWPGSTTTAYWSIARSTAATSSGVSGLRTSMPVTRAPMCVVRGWTSIDAMDASSVGLAQPRGQELALVLEHRIGGGGHDVVVDDLEVAQRIEMQRAGLGRVGPARAQAVEMGVHRGRLKVAEHFLLAGQQAGGALVAGHEQRGGGADVGD